jgi:hypothetical protein
MTRGQDSLEIALGGGLEIGVGVDVDGEWPPAGLAVLEADADEREAHQALLTGIARDARKPALWTTLEAGAVEGAGREFD